ncbi:MAG: ABC transporter permease [Acidimicrobiia bacterium]|nr:ABC transporter permease [Acidimicrobiia bacterium]
MIRSSLRSLRSHAGQLALTVVSIALGVSFVVGTLIYTATTSRAFDGLFNEAFGGIDIDIQPEIDLELLFNPGEVPRLDESLLNELAAVPGVEKAWGLVESTAAIASLDGEVLGPSGPPPFAFNWPGDDIPIALDIVEGRSPAGPAEVMIDQTSFEQGDLDLGDTVAVFATGGREEFTVVGVTNFAGLPSLAGSNATFTTETARRLFDAEGQFTRINATVERTADLDQVILEASRRLGDSVNVVNGQTAAEEGAAQITEALGFLNTFLLVFAGVSVFVATFIIYNTFRILISRRTRELSLLRALGATSTQVTRATLVESVMVGLVASLLGVVLGLGLAIGLRALLEAFGIALPSTNLVVSPSAVVIGLVLGIVVTVVSALVPIWRVRSITPMEGLREIGSAPGRRPLIQRVVSSLGLLAIGVALLVVSLFTEVRLAGQSPIVWVGIGSALALLAVILISPVFVPPVMRFLGAPFVASSKSTGLLAQRNAIRSPRRTAATSAAALVCVALMTLASVFVASLLGVIDEALDSGFRADLVVTAEGFAGPTQGFSPAVGDAIEALDTTDIVGRQRRGLVRVDGDIDLIVAVSDREFDLIALERESGTMTDLGDSFFAADFVTAEQNGWEIGDEVSFDFLAGSIELELSGLFQATGLSGIVVGLDAYASLVPNSQDAQIDIRFVDGTDLEAARAQVEEIVDQYPTLQVADQSDLREQSREQTLQALGFIFGLLGLAVGVAFVGLANTTVLSTLERTREIGLLRAVGLDRGALRRMIYFESMMIAAFGAVLGVVAGIGLARALLMALEDQGFTVFVIPWPGLIALVFVISLLGLVAAGIPAWRAARSNILAAISYE